MAAEPCKLPRGCSSVRKPKLCPVAGVAQVGLGMVPRLEALQAVGWLLTKIWLWGLLEDTTGAFGSDLQGQALL